MKVTFRLLIFLLLISCNKKSVEEFPEYETQEQLNKRIIEGKPFFDFDEVVHYQVNISKDEFYNLLQTDTLSNETKLLADLLGNYCPKTEKEINNFKEAIKLSWVSLYNIDTKFTDELYAIFSEKRCDEIWRAACEPIYRDIFIFKKNKNEIGIAKICFDCGLYSFSKGDFVYDCFGMNDELKKLKKIISENKKLK